VNIVSASQITDSFSNGICVLLTVSTTWSSSSNSILTAVQTVLETIYFLLMAKYESNVKLHVKQIKHIAKRRNVIYLWRNRLR